MIKHCWSCPWTATKCARGCIFAQEQSQGRGTDRESPSEHVGPPSGTLTTNGRPCA